VAFYENGPPSTGDSREWTVVSAQRQP
jgi:hypothetical protein